MTLKSPDRWAPCRVLALADDLSGAAETSATLRVRSRIVLGPAVVEPPEHGEAVVLDLDTRQLRADEAARVVAAAVAPQVPQDCVLFKKVDSLLRGNLAAETAAYAAGARAVVIATALPVAGRTVRDGVVHLHGTPLHATDAWRAEPRPAPRSTPEALDGVRTTIVPLDTVRSGARALAARLRTVAETGRHPVCDAETDADLDAIVEGALQRGPGVRLLGTGGLADALGRTLTSGPRRLTPHQDATVPHPATTDRPLLIVVGTAEPAAVAQITQLTARGVAHHALPPAALDDPASPPVLDVDPHRITVVSIDNSLGVQPGSARRLVAGLARAVTAVPRRPDLVLTGGETARRVLDALGISRLDPVGQIHHGAVHARTPEGRSVVTRPGSYGETDSLLRIARALRPHAPFAPHVLPPTPALPVPQGESP